jgi:hypothetical protein
MSTFSTDDLESWMPIAVKQETIGGVYVSTVNLRSYSDSRFAETMIFLNEGPVAGLVDQSCERGPAEDALAQHARWAEKVRAAVQS